MQKLSAENLKYDVETLLKASEEELSEISGSRRSDCKSVRTDILQMKNM